MIGSYTPTTIFLIAIVAIAIALAAPPISNGVTIIEAGKHRIWFTRRGWVYDYDRQNAGTVDYIKYGNVTVAKGRYWSKAGDWPWHSPS